MLILFSNYENEKRKSTTDFRFTGGRKTNCPLHDTRIVIQCCIHNIQMGFNSRLFCIRKHVKSGDKQRIASKLKVTLPEATAVHCKMTDRLETRLIIKCRFPYLNNY